MIATTTSLVRVVVPVPNGNTNITRLMRVFGEDVFNGILFNDPPPSRKAPLTAIGNFNFRLYPNQTVGWLPGSFAVAPGRWWFDAYANGWMGTIR